MNLHTRFTYSHGQVYLYDSSHTWSDANEFIEALEQIETNEKSVGISSRGLVDLIMPRDYAQSAKLSIETNQNPLPLNHDSKWDQIVEFDLELPAGHLILEPSGGSKDITQCDLDLKGILRARWYGCNFDTVSRWIGKVDDSEIPEDATDNYKLELWPQQNVEPVLEIQRWDGFDTFFNSIRYKNL